MSNSLKNAFKVFDAAFHAADENDPDRPLTVAIVRSTPGLRGRVAQLKEAYGQEASMHQAAKESGAGTTGTVASRAQSRAAERALERQIRYQRGQFPVRRP